MINSRKYFDDGAAAEKQNVVCSSERQQS